jgi:hypothetical protein
MSCMGYNIICNQSTKLVCAHLVKIVIFFLLLFILIPHSYAQVGIGVNPPHPSAMLHVQDTAKGLLIPRMTAAQKNAINNPAKGLLIYQLDELEEGFWYFNGSQWTTIGASSNGGLHTVVLTDSVTNAQAIAQIAAEVGPNTQEIRIMNCVNLTTVDLSIVSNLVDVYISDNPNLQSVDFPNLEKVLGGFYVNFCPSLTTLNVPSLKKIGMSFDGYYGFYLLNSGLSNVSLPLVSIITGSINVMGNPNLTSVSFAQLLEHNGNADIAFRNNNALTSISFPSLRKADVIITMDQNHSLASINLPALTTVKTLMIWNTGNSLTSISLPALTTVTNGLLIKKDTGLINFSVPLLTAGAEIEILNNNALLSLDFPSLTTSDGLILKENLNLVSITFDNLISNGLIFDLNGNKLPSTQINALLSRFVAINPPLSGKIFDLRQSVAAPPTGQGLIDKATLIARPNTVSTD